MAYWPSPGFLNPGPMQPWAKIGENILVKRVQKFVPYRVVWLEQLPLSSPLMVDFGAIAANSTDAANSLQVPLEMDGYELGQWRMCLMQDFSLQVYEPQNLPRFVDKNARARLSYRGQCLDRFHSQSEMAVYQDEYPYVDVINNRDYAITAAQIAFYGFRYRLTRLAINGDHPYFDAIEQVPNNVPFVCVMAEGFVGTGYERGGLGLS